MKRLYIFNPEHDLSLAAGTSNYQAPESAMFLASDLALLPKWYAENSAIVFDRSEIMPIDPNEEFESVVPWGWDKSVKRLLIVNGINESILPSDEHIEAIKQLSHRRTATHAMAHLRATIGNRYKFPLPAAELHSLDEVKLYAETHDEVVIKAPWSSSGRGVYWTTPNFTPSLGGWIKRTIEKQGSIMAEVAMDRVMDFAMEFKIENMKCEFIGYSLFFTEGQGAYRGNRLMSNERIEEVVSEWIDTAELNAVRQELINFMSSNLTKIYEGYVGVDMFIYRGKEGFLLNPVVEINLRMTMGMVARQLYDKYVAPGSEGMFIVEHKTPGRLMIHHQWQEQNEKMEYDSDGKFVKGYLSLCPVTENSLYRASIQINRIN